MLGAFDLYGLFVEQLFGGLLIACVGLAVIYIIVMALGKLSYSTMISVIILYLIVFGIFSNALTFFIILVAVLFYFVTSLIRFFSGRLN